MLESQNEAETFFPYECFQKIQFLVSTLVIAPHFRSQRLILSDLYDEANLKKNCLEFIVVKYPEIVNSTPN